MLRVEAAIFAAMKGFFTDLPATEALRKGAAARWPAFRDSAEAVEPVAWRARDARRLDCIILSVASLSQLIGLVCN